MERSWLLTHRDRPWLLNEERAGGTRGVGGHYGRARLVKAWRDAYAGLCLEQRVPALQWVKVEALQACRDGRMPDIGAAFPAVKAAIDGVVDAGVIPDDNAAYLHALTFLPPSNMGYDALILRVTGPVCSPAQRLSRERDHQRKLVKQLTRR
jgi:hypothetical protein